MRGQQKKYDLKQDPTRTAIRQVLNADLQYPYSTLTFDLLKC